MLTLELIVRISKFFAASLVIFQSSNKIILILQQNYFQICSKIFDLNKIVLLSVR